MKTALIFALFVLSMVTEAHASGAVTIEIKTSNTGTSYTLHKRGYYDDMEAKTPAEIETWLRESLKKIPERDPIFIYADDQTPFKTVVEMLRRFKAAGVKRFVVWTGTGADVKPAISANFDDFRLPSLDATSPPK